MEIKNLNGDVIYKDDSASLRETILNAYRAGADLTGAYLPGADLRGADLTRADLTGAKYADFEIKIAPLSIENLRYNVLIFDNHMKVGCHLHTHVAWAKFTTREIAAMNGADGAKWWRTWKRPLLEMCNVHAAQARKAKVKKVPALEKNARPQHAH